MSKDVLGWLATCLFVSSYFFKAPKVLLSLQFLGALAWLSYGIALSSTPMMVANTAMSVASLVSLIRTLNKTNPPTQK
jgi:hypothetical protein